MAVIILTQIWDALRWTWHDADGYAIISGPLADITLLGGAYALYRHHNCHVRGCPRIGRHHVEGTTFIVCRRHHPHEAPTAHEVLAAHQEAMDAKHALAAATALRTATAEAAGPGAG